MERTLFRPVGRAAAAGMLLLLGACQGGDGNGGPVLAAPPGFRCPAAGTRVTFASGVVVTHQGPDHADSSICLSATGAGQPQRLLYNLFPLPLVDEPTVREGYAALWPLAVNRAVRFVNRQEAGGTIWEFQETWRVERAETLAIDGVARPTLVLRRTQEGVRDNRFLGHQVYWLDTATGLWLKRTVEVIRGNAWGANYEATRIEAR